MSHSHIIGSQHVVFKIYCISAHKAVILQSETGVMGIKENLGHLHKDYSLHSWRIIAAISTFRPPPACHFTHAYYTALPITNGLIYLM